jgi:hypothetical protein
VFPVIHNDSGKQAGRQDAVFGPAGRIGRIGKHGYRDVAQPQIPNLQREWSLLGGQIIFEYAETTGNVRIMDLKQ